MDVPKKNNLIMKTRDVKLRKVKKSVVMWPVKPKEDMQLKKPAAKDKSCQVTIHNKKQVPKDNSCKSTRIYKKSKCSDKNCQENSVMWSVTKETDMQLPKLARLCSDKNCQSTRCYQKRRPIYSCDKNCQL